MSAEAFNLVTKKRAILLNGSLLATKEGSEVSPSRRLRLLRLEHQHKERPFRSS